MKRGKPLERKTPLRANPNQSKSVQTLGTSTLKRGRGFAASPAQQEKARTEPCVVTGHETVYGATVDPMHLWPRSRGGCSDPLCVVPGIREVHEAFDRGEFDLLPYLVKRRVPELCHALEHAEGDVESLFRRLAPSVYRNKREAA